MSWSPGFSGVGRRAKFWMPPAPAPSQLFTTAVLLAELQDVLRRPKFAERLTRAAVTADQLVGGYGALAGLVQPVPIPPVIAADPDDDAVLACALAVAADAIVSGDRHLLELAEYQKIPIRTPPQFVAEIPKT
jgi:putative PIN family toxin of toxin-antitoxin system